MIVNHADILATQFEAKDIPVGTELLFSDLEVLTNPAKGEGYQIMREGILTGYDDFGNRAHIVVHRRDEEGLPVGEPKLINTSCIRRLITKVELDQQAETVSEPTVYKGVFTLGRQAVAAAA